MSEQKVPIPAINEESAPFWEGTLNDKLLIKRCNGCGEHHWYPRSKCPFCHSLDTAWVESGGEGVIYSYSTMRRVAEPFTLAYVTLDEGVSLMTNIVDCDPDTLAIGQRVAVVFRQSEDCKVPYFTPV